jgi:protein involved in polysaccharide export with SLBB domain
MKNVPITTLVVLLSLLISASPKTHAQSPAATEPDTDTVAPGDTLCIGVSDLHPARAELLKTVHVTAAGDVRLFYVGSIHIAGLSFEDAEKAIAKAYKDAAISNDSAVTINRLATGTPPATLKPGDRLSIKIIDLAGSGRSVARILPLSPAGKLSLPYLGQIKLAGYSEAEAETAIQKAYADKQIVKEALISVLLLQPGESTEPTIEPPEPDPAASTK